MDFLPSSQQERQITCQCLLNGSQITPCEAVILPERYIPLRNIQLKNRFVSTADNMHVRGPMIVRIHNHPESANPHYGWHYANIA